MKRVRRAARGKARGQPQTLIQRGPNIVPDRYMCKLVYHTSGNYTSAIGAPFDQVMRANSVFDPDATGIGGQATGYDQMAALYNQYTVLASKCNLAIVNTNLNAAELVLVPTTDVTALTTLELPETYPYAKIRLMAPGGSGGALQKVTSYMTTAKFYGKNKEAILADNQFSATTSNSPVEQWFWHSYVEPTLTGAAVSVSWQINMTYYVLFYDRITLGAS